MVFVWVVAAAIAGGIELLTADLTFGVIAVALGASGVAAFFGAPLWAQFLVGAAIGAFGLLVVRPIALRQMRRPVKGSLTNVDALRGRPGRAIGSIDSHGGLVRLGGEEWSARMAPGARPVLGGAAVFVVEIDGATAVVAPTEGEER